MMDLLTPAERRDLLLLCRNNCIYDGVSDMPLFPMSVRQHAEAFDLMANGFDLDNLMLPPRDRREIESLLDQLSAVVIRRRGIPGTHSP